MQKPVNYEKGIKVLIHSLGRKGQILVSAT